MKKLSTIPALVAIVALVLLSACSPSVQVQTNPNAPVAAASNNSTTATDSTTSNAASPVQQVVQPVQAQATTAPSTPAQPVVGSNSLLSAYQSTLESIYSQVDPSVVSVHVVSQSTASVVPNNPFGRNFGGGQQGGSQVSEALGSGFVYDMNGDIITNNHVVSGATSIDVTFSDGKNYTAKVVGTDVYSDLAVIKSDAPASELHPVTLADASQVKVGEVTIAIGNPYGLQNTMTVGVVSALGRTLPAGSDTTTTTGPTYSIPDIIQTDAAINPGNSGGVLLNDQGQVIGVTAAIESSSNSNSGIGFVIPSTILNKVIPDLIKSGTHAHPYLGLSGMSLSVDINNAMNLNPQQQGALVETITAGAPADKAGLQASNNAATINGSSVNVGGDVIIAVNGSPVTSMDDLIAYLETNTTVGQKVTLTILRNGKQMTVDVTLGTRPSQPVAFIDPTGANSNSTLLSFPVSPSALLYQ
jgi:serine protease Do